MCTIRITCIISDRSVPNRLKEALYGLQLETESVIPDPSLVMRLTDRTIEHHTVAFRVIVEALRPGGNNWKDVASYLRGFLDLPESDTRRRTHLEVDAHECTLVVA